MTTLYLIRHSERINNNRIIYAYDTDSPLVQNEKDILSVEGEERAKRLADIQELLSVDKVYVSKCVRTLQTAKYLLEKLNQPAIIDERLDERRVGLPNDQMYPDWFVKQYKEFDFKTEQGESQRDVLARMDEVINEILDANKDKKVAIFSHGYAICFYLLKYGKLDYIDLNKNVKITYNNKTVLDGQLNAPEIFKLEFEGRELVSITNITNLLKK